VAQLTLAKRHRVVAQAKHHLEDEEITQEVWPLGAAAEIAAIDEEAVGIQGSE